MKVNIDSTEWYPVYTLITGEDIYEDDAIEMPLHKVLWVRAVFKAFQKVQDYLEELERKNSVEDEQDS